MNYMIKSIAAKVISHFFCEYIDQIDSSQLELAIWDGKARLENLKIVKDALATHNLPFTVNNGSIGSISLLFPWSRLKSEPCVINVEDVFIVASVSGNILISQDLETKQAVEKLHEEESTVSEGGTFSSILSQIIDNIQFHIKNLHLRVELNVNNSIVAIGITISSINSFSVNEALEYAFISLTSSILRKKVEVSDLSIYIDPDQEPISTENFSIQMEKLIYGNHHYILRPFSFSGHIYFHRQASTENPDNQENNDEQENQDNTTELHVDTKGINLALDELQWRSLMELERQYAMFNTRRKYSHCGKPTNYPRSDRSSSKWWSYAHRCAIDKTNKISFDAKNALNILSNRKKYVSLIESGDVQKVKEFEKNFDLPIVLFLRNYANAAKKNKEANTRLSPEEIEAVMKEQKKLEPQTLNVVLNMGVLSISFLKKDMSPITRFLFNSISAKYVKQKFNNQIELGIQNMTMFNEMSTKFNKTLTSNGGVKVIFISKADEPNNINIETSGITFIIDLKFLDQIVDFFKKERKFILIDESSDSNSKLNTEAKKKIQTVIDLYKGINLNININDTSIVLPYQECEDCPLLTLNCQKTTITAKPNTNLNANDLSTLYDNYIIKFNDSMLFLDKNPLLFKKFDCDLNILLAIIESNTIDGLLINCLFDQFLAHITTVQFLTIENTILYVVDSIRSLFKSDIENFPLTNSNSYESMDSVPLNSVTSNNNDAMKNNNESRIQFTLNINKIDFSICIYTGKIFEFLSNNFDLKLHIDQFIDVKGNLKGLTGYEFITSASSIDFENNKFSYIDQFNFEYSDKISDEEPYDKVNIDVNNTILYAKQKCLLYIIELFGDPDNFEKIFDNNDSFNYSKIQHKLIQSSDSLMVVKANVNNIRGILSTNTEKIGEIIVKNVETIVNIDSSWSVDLNLNDCLFKNNDQFIEIMDKTLFKANPFLVQIQRINPIIANLNFDYVMDIADYFNNLTLKKEEETTSSYSLMNYDILVKSIIGSFNDIKFNINEVCLKGKSPIQLNFSLNSFDAILDDIQIASIKNIVASMENEIIDETLFNDFDNFEKNKLYTHKFIESEKDIKLLLTTKFIVCSSRIRLNINSLNFSTIPSIMNSLPSIENISNIIKKQNQNANNIVVKSKNSLKHKFDYKTKFNVSFRLNAFSLSLIEEKKNLLSLNLGQIKYYNNKIKIGTFSLLSDGYEPIAICKENFFSCSDSLNLFKIQNIDFIIDYNLFLELTKYILLFSPILSYSSFFTNKKPHQNNNNNNDDDNNSEIVPYRDNRLNSIEADVNRFSFLIKEDDVNLSLTIAFKIRPNHFEINELEINFIIGELTLPLLQPLSIQYDFDSKPKLSISPLNLFIGIGDIKFLMKLVNKFLSLLDNNKKNMIEQPSIDPSLENGFDILSFIPQKLRISPVKMNIGLCFNDRSPFVTLKIESSKISFSKEFEYQLQLSIVYYNAETGNKDLILEPLKINSKVSISEKDKSFDIKSSPIIMNLHLPFLRRLIYFNHCRKKELKLDYQSYKFVNKMQSSITLKIGQIKHEEIKPGQSVPFSDVDVNETITIQYDYVHCEKFAINQLFYPTALSLSCFVYRENKKIMICPPYFFENSLDIPISAYSSNFNLINHINPHERVSLPTITDVEQGFIFVSGALNRSDYLKSSSSSNLSPFKSLSFSNLIHNPNSTSFESFTSSPRSPEKSVGPSLYFLGSWTSSQPTTYTIIDNTKEEQDNIVVYISQKLERNFLGIIEILPILTIVNELPFDLSFSVSNYPNKITVKGGCSVPCPMNSLNYNTEGIIVSQFESEKYGRSPKTTILYRETCKTEIVLTNSDDSTSLSLTAHAVVTPGHANLYIYSPAILINKCGFPLNIRRTSGSKPAVLNDHLLMGSYSFVNKSTLKMQIQCETYKSDWQREKIDCTAVGISSTVFLPTSNESIFVPIYVRNRKAKSPFNHSTVIVFSPALIFVNETKHSFTLSPCTIDKQFWLKVEPNSRVPIIYSTSKSNFIVQIDDIVDVGVKIVLALPTRKVFRFKNIFIEMETVLVSGSLCCHFRRARMPTPIVFSNLLKIPYSVYQIDSSNPIVIEPDSTSPFAYDDPFGDNSVFITIGDTIFNAKLSLNCEPTKIKDTGFFIEIKTAGKGHRMLAISERNLAVNFDTTFHFTLSIQDLLVSLITQNMTELCLISFHNFSFKTSNEGENSLYEFTLDSFQIDDQLNIAPFPTLLIGSSNQKAKFLHCSAICYREAPLFTSFKNLTFSMQKIAIYADMAFISDLYGLYKEIQIFIKKQKDKENQVEFNEQYFNQIQKSLLFVEDKKDETELHVGNLISFTSLVIHPFLASLTYRGMSGRPTIMPKKELPAALTIIPNITNANLSLKSFQVSNFLAPIAMLKENIFEGYKNELIMETWQIAGHSDIFFNVFGIAETFGNGFKSFFYDPIKANVDSPEQILKMFTKGGGQLIFGTLGSIIQGGEGFIKNISSFLSTIGEEDSTAASTDNTNLNAADTINEGITSLGNGFIDGISGLITKPVEGGKKDGIMGAVTGLAKGVIGAVAKPTAGLLDMSAGIIGGIRKTISSNDDIVKRFREPNSYPFAYVGGFNNEVSKIQSYVQKLNKKKKYYLMNLMAINYHNQFIYALFDKRIFFFAITKNGFEYSSKAKVSNITNISQAGKKVIFQIQKLSNKKFIFECPNQDTAEKFVIVLNSLVSFSNVFK